MSAEDGSAQAPAAVATFSSFINKNTTGKKFAPKAARRRPAATPVPKPSASHPAASIVEPQASQAEPGPSIAPAAEPPTATQLPTPAATQANTRPSASHAVPGSSEPSTAIAGDHVAQEQPSTALPPPAPTSTEETRVDAEAESPTLAPANTGVTPLPVQDELDTGRASKRRRMDPPAPKSTFAPPEAIVNGGDTEGPSQSIQPEELVATQHQSDEQVSPAVDAPAPENRDQAVETITVLPSGQETVIPRRRRTLPWIAVNHPRHGEEEVAASAPTKRTRQPTRGQGRKKANAEGDAGEAEQQEANEADEPQSIRKRTSAKARGKRKAVLANADDDADAQPPLKRTRMPRKAKGKEAAETVEVAEGETGQEADGGDDIIIRRKAKRKKRQTTDGEGEGVEDGALPKRKGRPPRESTPSDAEHQIIDPETTFMDGLASRNIRVGQLSNREKEMRQVDWAAVRQRRREEDSRPIKSKEEQEAADKALAEAGADLAAQQTESGPRFHVGPNGDITWDLDSGTINREAAADREMQEYKVIEDGDITSRITTRSFMKNNKRFPNDFLLPGQGRRWTAEGTDVFYQGLRSFGTDFQMISHMFPGSTRRSIKTKFTREEREYPERVREALQGRSEIATHWDAFLEASQMKEESFADVDEIKRQMAEDEARMRELITAAEEETKQRNLQKAAAGVLDNENEGADAGDKENENGKGKKKRKGKEKQAISQEDQGGEIVGYIDDDVTRDAGE